MTFRSSHTHTHKGPKAVYRPRAGYLMQPPGGSWHFVAINSPQSSAQLLVRHSVVFLPLSPHLCQGLGFHHPENALLPVFPLQDAAVFFRRQEQVSHKFPEVRTLEAFGRKGSDLFIYFFKF